MCNCRLIKLAVVLAVAVVAIQHATSARAEEKKKGTTVKTEAQTHVEVKSEDGKAGEVARTVKGKVIIVGPDGEKREIEFGDGQAEVDVKSIDGGKATGRIVIIGPDGEKKEFKFGDEGARLGLGLDKILKGKLRIPPGAEGKAALKKLGVGNLFAGKYMLGLWCTPVSETLRAHLKIDEGNGLVIRQVFEDTPAAKAGLQQHDILLTAGDKNLTSARDLLEAVEEAGTNKMSLTLIRAGKRMKVNVTPVARPKVEDAAAEVEDLRERIHQQLKDLDVDIDVEAFDISELDGGLRKLLDEQPGKIIERSEPRSTRRLEKRIDELSRRLEQLEKGLKKSSSGKAKD